MSEESSSRTLGQDYELVCKTMDDLDGQRIIAEARKISDPIVILKSGRHKAQRIMLAENVLAIFLLAISFLPKPPQRLLHPAAPMGQPLFSRCNPHQPLPDHPQCFRGRRSARVGPQGDVASCVQRQC